MNQLGLGTGLGPSTLDALVAEARGIPHLVGFPGVDELVDWFERLEAELPGVVSSRRIGTSRLGEPIRCVTIAPDHGPGQVPDIVVVAGVHPNEPIGFRTVQQLATSLTQGGAAATLPARWHVVPCIDPDGTRLNEDWFADPSDRRHYARRFYRPAPEEQVEWSFATDYKDAYFDAVMPETQALMRLLDATRPALYVSLHNGEMGGVYYYLSRPEPELAEVLRALPGALGLPLDNGEPEAPYLETYAPAVYGTGTIADTYDFLEGLGIDPAAQIAGSSSSEYVGRYGTLSLVAELPYWIHPDAADERPSDMTYRALLERTSFAMAESAYVLGLLLERATPYLTLDTPFLRATRAFVPALSSIAETDRIRAADPSAERPATVAEVFSCTDIVACFRFRYGGMLLRALHAETAAGTASAALRRVATEAEEVYAAWLAERGPGDEAEPAPVAALVGIQLGSVLAAAAAVTATGPASGAEGAA